MLNEISQMEKDKYFVLSHIHIYVQLKKKEGKCMNITKQKQAHI